MKILEIREKFLKGQLSPEDLTKSYLQKIEKEDEEIGAFLSVYPELALKEAKKAQKILQKEKEKSPILTGIPCAIKDNILVKGMKCTAGSKILEDFIAPYDATVIKKIKESQAIILGKTNLDEFAMGSSTENSAFFPTKNPLDITRVPGGSSGGSAAAVAANFCQFSLGSDTGGSIRQPAAFCNLVGLKPTYGRVSRYGLIALASSLDQIGPIAKNVEDAEIVFEIISGKDPYDSTTFEKKFSCPPLKDVKIGIPKEFFPEEIDPEIKEKTLEVIKKIEKNGFKVLEISLPLSSYSLPCYIILMSAEASSNLARYDLIKYGRKEIEDFEKFKGEDFYSFLRSKYFGKEVKRRIIMGTFVLSAGYLDEYYLRAKKVQQLIKKDFERAFREVNLILTPISPILPFKLGERIQDPLKMYFADLFTTSVNLAGLPALSLPAGKVKNLPLGIQLIAPAFGEKLLFEFGKIFQKING